MQVDRDVLSLGANFDHEPIFCKFAVELYL